MRPRSSAALTRLLVSVLIIAGAWSASSVGYFELLDVFGAEIGYRDAPWAYAVYYAGWVGLVLLVFRRSFRRWARQGTNPDYLAFGAVLALAFAFYALVILPRLPETEWTRTQEPVEFFWANAWYFLPKSVEILFQQVLIAELVLALSALRLPLWRVSLLVAVLFGGFHLTLALSYPNPLYVARYSVAATIFGALVPWLILRVRYGLLLSYAIHWSYYAIDIALIHFVFAAGPDTGM
jgi:uncharacterized membrane protein YuzA (DUF378 family)